MTSVPTLHDGEQIVYFQAGGDWCYLWTPETFRVGTPVPVLIHHHGAGGYGDGGADWFEVDQKVGYLKAIMQATGCAVASSHACGDHWGNACSTQANGVYVSAACQLDFHMGAARVNLLGGGLGGVLVWNTVLGPLAAKVKAAAVLQAVASLEDIMPRPQVQGAVAEGVWPARRPRRRRGDGCGGRAGPAATAATAARGYVTAAARPLSWRAGQQCSAASQRRRPGGCAAPCADVTLEIFPEADHFVLEMGQPIRIAWPRSSRRCKPAFHLPGSSSPGRSSSQPKNSTGSGVSTARPSRTDRA